VKSNQKESFPSVAQILEFLKEIRGIPTGHGSLSKLAEDLGMDRQLLNNMKVRGVIGWKKLKEVLPPDQFQKAFTYSTGGTTNSSGKIPLISYAGAGSLEVTDELAFEDQTEIVLPNLKAPKNAKVFALPIVGNSMEPEFYEGDIVFVTHEEHPRQGGDYVFVSEGRTLLKSYYKMDGHVELRSHNKAIRTITVRGTIRAFKILAHLSMSPKLPRP